MHHKKYKSVKGINKENLELFENNVDKDAYRHSNDFDIKDFGPKIDAIIFSIPFIFKRLINEYKSKIKVYLKKHIKVKIFS